jgi:hypothetical protein
MLDVRKKGWAIETGKVEEQGLANVRMSFCLGGGLEDPRSMQMRMQGIGRTGKVKRGRNHVP